MALGEKVRKLDVFKKVPKDFSEGTNRGGVLSLLTMVCVLYLVAVEIAAYLNPEMTAVIKEDKLVTRKEMKYSSPQLGSISTSLSRASPVKSSRSISKTSCSPIVPT
jgi:hypothetical protein